jgi:hypothetical protein
MKKRDILKRNFSMVVPVVIVMGKVGNQPAHENVLASKTGKNADLVFLCSMEDAQTSIQAHSLG